MNWKKLGLTTLSASALLLAACGGGSQSENAIVEDREIEIAHTSWTNDTVKSSIAQNIFEELGYDVTLSSVDPAVMFQSVAQGESDVLMSAWLPVTHGSLYEEYQDQLVHAGVIADGAKIGLAVPTYMEDVNSIEDLSDQAGQTITGIEPGAGIMANTELVLEEYENLSEWDLSSSSTGAMMTELGNAIDNQEEIVITGWNPHWMFQTHDIKYLEDPQGVYGEEETMSTFTRQGLPEEDPIAFSVLENFQIQLEDIETGMQMLDEGIDPDELAQQWIDNNQDLVEEITAEAEEIASQQNSNE